MSKSQIFIRTVILGLIGVVVLTLVVTPPMGLPRILIAVNPTVLLLLFAALGMWTARKAGLKSALILGDPLDRSAIIKTAGFAIVVGALIALFDHLTAPIWRPEASGQLLSLVEAASWQGLFVGVTYGGITEEIMMRWGVMSGLMALVLRFANRQTAAIIALSIAGLIFAAGHLPAVIASGIALEPALLARIIVLNAGLGAWFGWLYYKRDLETAISAHAGFHVGAFILGMLWV